MPEKYSFYDTLGVRADASPDEIRDAFRRNVAKYHPDVNPAPNAEMLMAMLNEAWETLRDPARRAAYDAQRASPQRPPPPPNNSAQAAQAAEAANAAREAGRRAEWAAQERRRKASEAAERDARLHAAALQEARAIVLARERRRRERFAVTIIGLFIVAGLGAWLFIARLTSVTNKPAAHHQAVVHSVAGPKTAPSVMHVPQPRPSVPPVHASGAAPQAAAGATPAALAGPPLAAQPVEASPAAAAGGESAEPAQACTSLRIRSIGDGGATVTTTDARSYTVSSESDMRAQVAGWSRPDAVIVCRAGDTASILDEVQGEKVDAVVR